MYLKTDKGNILLENIKNITTIKEGIYYNIIITDLNDVDSRLINYITNKPMNYETMEDVISDKDYLIELYQAILERKNLIDEQLSLLTTAFNDAVYVCTEINNTKKSEAYKNAKD
jgi:hypothetical protein